MSPTPIWLVGHRGQAAIAATGVSGAALNSLFYRSNCLTGSAGRSHCRRVLAASSGVSDSSASFAAELQYIRVLVTPPQSLGTIR